MPRSEAKDARKSKDMEWLQFDLEEFGVDLVKVIVSCLLTLPIAWEQEKSTRIMGLRTFSLIAVASCGYVLVALGFIDSDSSFNQIVA